MQLGCAGAKLATALLTEISELTTSLLITETYELSTHQIRLGRSGTPHPNATEGQSLNLVYTLLQPEPRLSHPRAAAPPAKASVRPGALEKGLRNCRGGERKKGENEQSHPTSPFLDISCPCLKFLPPKPLPEPYSLASSPWPSLFETRSPPCFVM
jgi:hypothetical protein